MFERGEEGVAEERIAAAQRVPPGGIDLGDTRRDPGKDFGFAIGHGFGLAARR
jgi:hypothetical protein